MASRTSGLVADAEEFVRAAYSAAGLPASSVTHSLLVGALLSDAGCSATVVAAGLLHDVLEDTEVTAAELRARFGDDVGDLVEAVTEDGGVEDYADRKAALRGSIRAGGLPAQLMSAADKVARLRVADEHGQHIEDHMLDHYRRSLEMLLTSGHRIPLADEFRRRMARHVSGP